MTMFFQWSLLYICHILSHSICGQEEQRRAEEAAAEAQAAEARAAEEMRRAEEAQAMAATEDFQEPPPAPPGAMSEGPFASPDEIAQRAEAALAQRAADTGRPRTAGRKPPKVTSKVTTTEQSTAPSNVAAPVVIAEGGDEQEEDMFETGVQPGTAPPPPPPPVDDGGQHGALVSDLLAEKKKEEERENRERLKKEEEETREEFDDGKGIKMKLRRKKDTGSSLAEVDPVKLGESIQSLCQAANPLGKSIDLVHQDIANMGKELDHWKQAYREASDAYTRQLKMTEDQLQPLYQKIAELDDKIAEQRSKIRNSRSRISKNDLKVQQLLESVVMVRTNLNGVHQGLGLTPPAGLTVEPIRLAPAQCLPSVPVSTTPEPPWQGALPSLASRAPWLDARPGPSGVSPRSVGPQEAEMLFKMQVTGPEVPAAHPQSLQPQQAQSQNLAHPPRQSLSPESPTLPWSPITGSLAPAAKQHGRGRGQSPPNSPGPNLGRNSPPLEPPMSHPSYPQPFLATRLPAPPGGGMMREQDPEDKVASRLGLDGDANDLKNGPKSQRTSWVCL
eukprot:s2598_g3.t1